MSSRLRQLATVFAKEVRETARDRRTLWTALILGPIGAPLLFTVMMNLGIERGRSGQSEPVALAVCGARLAPQLVGYLASVGATIVDLDAGAAHADDDGCESRIRATLAERALNSANRARVALAIGPHFAARLRQGVPAPLAVYADTSDHKTETQQGSVRRWLQAYGAEIAALRLQVRGINPQASTPLSVDEIDIATPASRSLVILGMLSYFILLATLVGGLHVAIDMTAGERERGSLESLLTLPVGRSTLLLGKLAAASFYMVVALAIALTAFGLALPKLGLESLGMRANFDLGVALRIFVAVLPFVPVGATLLTLVASFTRSYREAQTWLSFVLLVPTLPIVFASLYQIEPRPLYMLVPSLSQHLLITSLLRDEGLSPALWATSALACLAVAALLASAALRLWRREALLG